MSSTPTTKSSYVKGVHSLFNQQSELKLIVFLFQIFIAVLEDNTKLISEGNKSKQDNLKFFKLKKSELLLFIMSAIERKS